jgi:diguanylate cyclase (GGDEF)-like protein/PAS domain S-box-containing protein
MLVTDADVLILRINRAFTTIAGYTTEEVLGKSLRIFQSGRHDAKFYESMWNGVNENGEWEGEVWNRRKSGEIYPVRFLITAVKDRIGVVTNYVVAIMDITYSKSEEDKIKSLAFYDPLTGLPNRRLFMDRLKSALTYSARNNRKGGLLFIDLDKFKALNDTLGHDLGDLLLQEVARRIEGCVREGDTVARLGGDEFVVMLENLSESILDTAAQTEMISNKILKSITEPFALGTYKYHNHASIGMTLICGYRHNSETLLREADLAMYKSKRMGGNCVSFFDVRIRESVDARITIENELRKALVGHQFILYYHLRKNSNHDIIGAKGIIHWLHPHKGIAGPEYFIPIAEEMGFIISIGEWIIESACAQLKAWSQNPLTRDLVLSINVSAKQFHHTNFAIQVLTAIRRHNVTPNKLKIELTESIFLGDVDAAIATMYELKEVGIKFALSDLGAGSLSLKYLKRLPLDQLNISQIFVSNITTDRGDLAIVRGVIAMAQALDLNVLALGVDTEEQQKLLMSNGCSRFEGYLYGRPAPVEHLEMLLKRADATIV